MNQALFYDEIAEYYDLIYADWEWEWLDESHYTTTMIVEVKEGETWTEVVRTSAQYYAVRVTRLLDLMAEAGLKASLVEDVPFFQSILCGSAG